MNKCSGWLGFGDQGRLARACLPQPITAWSRGFRAFQGLAPGSLGSNHKQGFTGQGPISACERRGPTRARGITALPERALPFRLRRRCGAWPLHPSCLRWPFGCSDPLRTAASVIVRFISRLFGKRVGSGGRPWDSEGLPEHLRPGRLVHREDWRGDVAAERGCSQRPGCSPGAVDCV